MRPVSYPPFPLGARQNLNYSKTKIRTDSEKTGRRGRRSKKLCLFVVAFLVVGIALSLPRPGFSAEIAAALKRPYVEDEVLVKFRNGVSSQARANAHGPLGAKRVKEFKIVRGLELVKIPATMTVKEAIRIYREDPDILYAEPNYIARAQTVPNDPSYLSLWGLTKINAPGAWDLSTGGSNVVIGTIDTGIDYSHPDLASNTWRNSQDCNNNGVDDDENGYIDDCHGIDTVNHDSDPMDDHNHGSHVAGIIGAVGNNGIGVVGVNWNISIIACKFLGADSSGPISSAIECLEYFKLMKERGANIVATNNSWLIVDYNGTGPGSFSQGLYDAIEEHRKSGILFIASAGNFGLNSDITPTYPASNNQSNVISVAATDSLDGLASFSNRGRRTVHLGAPGVSILSTAPDNRTLWMSGTSMAAPYVSGVAALLKAYNPQLDWKAIKNLILAGGDSVSSPAGTVTGKRLNARGALSCHNSTVLSRLRPISDRISTSIGMSVNLAALHINCAAPNGEVSVTANPGDPITLRDNGQGFDQDAGDGIYSGQWAPPLEGTYTLNFPDGDVLTVDALKNYRVQSTSSLYRIISGTSLNLGDNATASINTPFPILFGGSSYNQLFISSNGTLSFTAPFSSSWNSSIPTPNIDTLVAPFWDDLFPVAGTAQNIFWAVTGGEPSRELVVEWRDVRHGSCNTDPSSVKFQVVFFEGGSNILFNYADTSFGGNCRNASGGGYATIGVQIAGNVATQFSYYSKSLSKTKSLLWTLIDDPAFPPPQLSAPANGATGVSTTPSFSWSAVSGAASYRIMAAVNQTDLPVGPSVNLCPGCVIDSTSTATSFTPAMALARGTRYFWQVKAQGSSGQPGIWSEQRSFLTDPTLPPPALASPANGVTNVALSPTFTWSSVSGATSYRLMAAPNQAALPGDLLVNDCSGCVINSTSTTNFFTPSTALALNTVYYWQVRAEGSSGGYWSTKSSFTTVNIFPAPTLISPSDGALGVPTKPAFRWQEVTGAPSYRIMAATSPSTLPTGPTDTRCKKCVINATSNSPSFLPGTALTPGAVYYWQVRAEGSSGQGGYWSQHRFTTIPSGSGAISITSVTSGAVINDYFVLVRGFVNIPSGAEIGVTVNGQVAFVDSGQFAVQVPLDETVTALTAVVKDALGNTLGSQTISVTVQIPATEQPILTLLPYPVMGPAPLNVVFDLNCLEPVSRLDFDAEGNGTIDFQGTTLKDRQFTYQVPGLYFPKVAVVDKANNTYTRTAILWVTSQTELDPLLQSKWTAMKNALRNGDIPGALKYIAISRRSDYEQAFRGFSILLAQIDQVLTDITFIEMKGETTAEYEMVRGGFAYLVRFGVDEDGVWRIQEF